MNGLLMSVLFLASSAFAVPITSEEAAELNSEYTHQSNENQYHTTSKSSKKLIRKSRKKSQFFLSNLNFSAKNQILFGFDLI